MPSPGHITAKARNTLAPLTAHCLAVQGKGSGPVVVAQLLELQAELTAQLATITAMITQATNNP